MKSSSSFEFAASGIRVSFLSLIFTVSVFCGSLYVSVTGSDANNCLSPALPCRTIQAAVNKSANGDSISVGGGTFAEVVHIEQRENLTISGTAGTVITHPGLTVNPEGVVIVIDLSRRITVQDLRVTGLPATDGVRIHDSVGIRINRCTVDGTGGAGGGFFVFGLSSVSINDSNIQDNDTGIRVDESSVVNLSGAPFSGGTSIVQRNGIGVIVRSGVFGLQGATIIQNNGIGINGTGGTVRSCCEDGATRKIINNDVGIVLRGTPSLDLRGPLEISGNHNFGIRQFGGFVGINDRVVVRNNGNAGTAGIAVVGGHLQLLGNAPGDIEISNNPGYGLLLSDNSSARIVNTTIKNNGGHGVRIEALSTAMLFDSVSIFGNHSFDLSCSHNSFERGDNSGVVRLSCHGSEHEADSDGPDH